MWVSLVALVILSLSLDFSRLITPSLWVNLIITLWVNFYLSCIGFTELLEYVGFCLLTNWESFLPLFLNKFSSGTLSFSSPPRSLLICMWDLLVLSNQFLSLCIFFFFVNYFSWCYSEWRIYADILKISKSAFLNFS